jgi:TP901 family phage tail tape measure protein
MLSLANQMGLGIVLSWRNKVSAGAKKAEGDLKKLKNTSKRTAEQFEKDVARMQSAMEGYQKRMRTGMMMAGAGMAILAPLALMTRESAEAEQGLADIESLLIGTGTAAGLAKQQISMLGNQILDVAPQSRITIEALTASSYDLVSANLTINEAMGLLKPTADLAVAGMGNMAEATDSMTSVYNTFAKTWDASMTSLEKGDKIANVYAGTIAALKTTLPDLSAAMKYAAADAVVLGTSLAETTTAIGLLQTKGIFGAKAGTMMMAMFRGFTQMSMRSADALGPLAGMNLKDVEGNLRPLADIIGDMERRLEGLGGFEKSEVLLKALGEESSKAVKLLLGQSGAFRTLAAQIDASTAAHDMMSARQDTANSGLLMMWSSIKGIAISLGNAFLPVIRIFTLSLRTIAFWIRRLQQTFPTFTRLAVLLVAIVGISLVLVGAWKMATAALGIFKTMMAISALASTVATGGFLAMAASVWATLWPILLVVAALGGLLYLLGKIAGIDIFGGVSDLVTGKAMIPEMPQINMQGGALALSGVPIIERTYGEEAGASQTTVHDNSISRTQNIFHIDGAKKPEVTAREVQKIQDRNQKRGHNGEY